MNKILTSKALPFYIGGTSSVIYIVHNRANKKWKKDDIKLDESWKRIDRELEEYVERSFATEKTSRPASGGNGHDRFNYPGFLKYQKQHVGLDHI